MCNPPSLHWVLEVVTAPRIGRSASSALAINCVRTVDTLLEHYAVSCNRAFFPDAYIRPLIQREILGNPYRNSAALTYADHADFAPLPAHTTVCPSSCSQYCLLINIPHLSSP